MYFFWKQQLPIRILCRRVKYNNIRKPGNIKKETNYIHAGSDEAVQDLCRPVCPDLAKQRGSGRAELPPCCITYQTTEQLRWLLCPEGRRRRQGRMPHQLWAHGWASCLQDCYCWRWSVRRCHQYRDPEPSKSQRCAWPRCQSSEISSTSNQWLALRSKPSRSCLQRFSRRMGGWRQRRV